MNREEDMTQQDPQTPNDETPGQQPISDQQDASQGEGGPLKDDDRKLADAEQQAVHYKDLFLRKAAEFENFKRRTEQEAGLIVRYANEELLLSVLPVVDDLERFLKNAADSRESAFYKGVELIYQKLIKVLQAQDVKPFETVGKEFDVHFHDALLQVPKKGTPPHVILEEVARGYWYHDKVLRHAKVIVSADADNEQEVDASDRKEQSGTS